MTQELLELLFWICELVLVSLAGYGVVYLRKIHKQKIQKPSQMIHLGKDEMNIIYECLYNEYLKLKDGHTGIHYQRDKLRQLLRRFQKLCNN